MFAAAKKGNRQLKKLDMKNRWTHVTQLSSSFRSFSLWKSSEYEDGFAGRVSILSGFRCTKRRHFAVVKTLKHRRLHWRNVINEVNLFIVLSIVIKLTDRNLKQVGLALSWSNHIRNQNCLTLMGYKLNLTYLMGVFVPAVIYVIPVLWEAFVHIRILI